MTARQEMAGGARRLSFLDALRGGALVAMIVFHGGWDLDFLGLGAFGLGKNLAWVAFGHAIAASFLALAGVSLVLAHGGEVDSLKFLRRLGLVSAAAVAVTGVTYFAIPDRFVYFGILHAIALGSVLALPLLRAPPALLLALAGLIMILPLWPGPIMASPALAWLGLSLDAPPSADFVPLLPWFGFMLLGMALARLFDLRRIGTWGGGHRAGRFLALAGRHSLAVYLLHQPILYGGLFLLAQAVAPPQERERSEFLTACTHECSGNGGDALRCAAICACAVEDLKGRGLWGEVIAKRLTPALKTQMDEVGRACATTSP